MNNLRKKWSPEASLSINNEKGRTRDPALEAAIQDAEELMINFSLGLKSSSALSLYVTLYAIV